MNSTHPIEISATCRLLLPLLAFSEVRHSLLVSKSAAMGVNARGLFLVFCNVSAIPVLTGSTRGTRASQVERLIKDLSSSNSNSAVDVPAFAAEGEDLLALTEIESLIALNQLGCTTLPLLADLDAIAVLKRYPEICLSETLPDGWEILKA